MTVYHESQFVNRSGEYIVKDENHVGDGFELKKFKNSLNPGDKVMLLWGEGGLTGSVYNVRIDGQDRKCCCEFCKCKNCKCKCN